MVKKLLLALIAVLLTLPFCGCDAEAGDDPLQTTAAPTIVATTTQETTEPAPVLEEQKVYLCTKVVMTHNDGIGKFYTAMEYNEFGQILKEIRTKEDGSPNGSTVYVYGENRELLTTETFNAENEKISHSVYEYDTNGNLIVEKYYFRSELKRITNYLYDSSGYLIEEAGGNKFVYEYSDDYTKMSRYAVTENGNELDQEKTFDAEGNLLSWVCYSGGTTVSKTDYYYDDNGMLLNEAFDNRKPNSSDYTIIYTYDSNNNLTRKENTYYYGSTFEYTYEEFTVLVEPEKGQKG